MSFLFSRAKVNEIAPEEAQQRHQEHAAIIVDVREPDEWRGGHIPGAKHIPLGEVQARAGELLGAPDVIFVCRSGSRSATAAKALEKAGHANVASLVGGMRAWQRAGLRVKQ